jgi:hypothetical protein
MNRFPIRCSSLTLYPSSLCIARTLLRPLSAALRTSRVLHRLSENLCAANAKDFPNLPKMHSLALGGGSLASLRVVCPERLQSQGPEEISKVATATATKPQQSSFTNQILHGDCIEVMRQMPDECVDFVLTDPPYLVNYRDRSGRTIQNDVDESWLKPSMAEAYRVLKQDRVAFMFYGWTKIDTFFEAWRSAGFQPVGHIVFRKSYASKSRFLRYQHEQAFLLAKGNRTPHSNGEGSDFRVGPPELCLRIIAPNGIMRPKR